MRSEVRRMKLKNKNINTAALTEEERRKKVLQDIIDMCEEYEDGDY